jgi:hypothetical protein
VPNADAETGLELLLLLLLRLLLLLPAAVPQQRRPTLLLRRTWQVANRMVPAASPIPLQQQSIRDRTECRLLPPRK